MAEGVINMLKDIKFEDLKEYIDLYLELGATYEGAFMLALEMVVG